MKATTSNSVFTALAFEIEKSRIERCRSGLKDIFSICRSIPGANQSVFDLASKALNQELDRLRGNRQSKIAGIWKGGA